jgi:hypothetical protein
MTATQTDVAAMVAKVRDVITRLRVDAANMKLKADGMLGVQSADRLRNVAKGKIESVICLEATFAAELAAHPES